MITIYPKDVKRNRRRALVLAESAVKLAKTVVETFLDEDEADIDIESWQRIETLQGHVLLLKS